MVSGDRHSVWILQICAPHPVLSSSRAKNRKTEGRKAEVNVIVRLRCLFTPSSTEDVFLISLFPDPESLSIPILETTRSRKWETSFWDKVSGYFLGLFLGCFAFFGLLDQETFMLTQLDRTENIYLLEYLVRHVDAAVFIHRNTRWQGEAPRPIFF